MSFPHVEDSGTFECRLHDDPNTYVQFSVMINEQRELDNSVIYFLYVDGFFDSKIDTQINQF